MSDFESFFTVANLGAVLDTIIDGHFDVIEERPRISTGADRIDLRLISQDRDKHLAAISRKVIEGRYTFNPFLEREIPKPGSTDTRTISIASIRDSVVQRALYEYLYPTVDARLTQSVLSLDIARAAAPIKLCVS